MVIIKPAIDMATHGEAQAKRGARRGEHPAPPVRGMLEFAISIAGVIKTRLPVDL